MAYTTIDDGSLYFHTQLYAGDGNTNRDITNDANSGDFKPDFLWLKNRTDSSTQHMLFNSTVGMPNHMNSDLTDAEQTATNKATAFNTDGFRIQDHSQVNGNSKNYVAWQWKVNGSTTSSNTDGSITSTVQVNTTAGISILTYSANATAGATVGHGLGTTPSVVILKKRSGTGDGNWMVGHKAYVGNSAENVALDGTGYPVAADDTAGSTWNRTAFTSTVFTLGDGQAGDWTGRTNRSGYSMLAYCFAEIKGYSKFGSYTGNGNADGPFVYTGFKPAWIMIKRIADGGNDWIIIDTTRFTFNLVDNYLRANTSDAETDQYAIDEDILSNGFKLRGTSGNINASSSPYIYLAFAKHPFVSSKGVPVTAR